MDSCVSRDEYVWILLSVGAKQELLKQLGHLKPVPQKIESVTKITWMCLTRLIYFWQATMQLHHRILKQRRISPLITMTMVLIRALDILLSSIRLNMSLLCEVKPTFCYFTHRHGLTYSYMTPPTISGKVKWLAGIVQLIDMSKIKHLKEVLKFGFSYGTGLTVYISTVTDLAQSFVSLYHCTHRVTL